jgi:hypothetical protein
MQPPTDSYSGQSDSECSSENAVAVGGTGTHSQAQSLFTTGAHTALSPVRVHKVRHLFSIFSVLTHIIQNVHWSSFFCKMFKHYNAHALLLLRSIIKYIHI